MGLTMRSGIIRLLKCMRMCVLRPLSVLPLYWQIVHTNARMPLWLSKCFWAADALEHTAPHTGHFQQLVG